MYNSFSLFKWFRLFHAWYTLTKAEWLFTMLAMRGSVAAFKTGRFKTIWGIVLVFYLYLFGMTLILVTDFRYSLLLLSFVYTHKHKIKKEPTVLWDTEKYERENSGAWAHKFAKYIVRMSAPAPIARNFTQFFFFFLVLFVHFLCFLVSPS